VKPGKIGLVVVLAVAAAGCGADDGPEAAKPVVAPNQRVSTIAAVKLVFGNPPRFDLVTFSADGRQMRSLLHVPAKEITRLSTPAWSPDAKRVYVVGVGAERNTGSFVYYESDLYSVTADGADLRRLTSTHDIGAVAPSPDGRRLVVARQTFGRGPFNVTSRLWSMTTDGEDARPLLDSAKGRVDYPGSWSPDGRELAFTRCRIVPPNEQGRTENTCGVYVVSADGSNLHKLADRSSFPAFSPDGERIALVTDRDESGLHRTGEDEEDFANELYVMNADGSHARRLTRSDQIDESSPSWSADGEWIAFARERASFVNQLMVTKSDGSCAHSLVGDGSDGDVSYDSPVWQPGRVVGAATASCG
jgi:Tol biopolymer transport system component